MSQSHQTAESPNSQVDAVKEPVNGGGFLAAGGKVSAVFNLAAATLGAGALAIPISILNAGIVGGVTLLLSMAILSTLSIAMIAKACHETGKESYEELIDHLFGKKVGYLFEIVMVLFCFGTCVTYMISIFDIVYPVLSHFLGANPTNWFAQLFVTRIPFTAIVAVVILLPLSLREHISEIRYVTFIGVCGVGFLAITSVYIVLRYGVSDNLPVEPVVPQDGFTSLLAAVNTYTFAYCNQPNVPEILFQLKDPNPRRFLPVVMWTVLICFSVYVTIGVSCFFAFGNDVKSSVIINMGQYISTGDPIVCIAFALMCIAVIGAFPLVVYPQRNSLVHFITTVVPTEDKRRRSIYGMIVVVFTVALSFIVAIALPDVNVMLGLVGSLTGSIICFFSPPAFMLKLSDKPILSLSHSIHFVLMTVGLFALVLGTYASVKSAIEYYQ